METLTDFIRYISGGESSMITTLNGEPAIVIKNKTFSNLAINYEINLPAQVIFEECVFGDVFIYNLITKFNFQITRCKANHFIWYGGDFEHIFLTYCEVKDDIGFYRLSNDSQFLPTSISVQYCSVGRIGIQNFDFKYITLSYNTVPLILFINTYIFPKTNEHCFSSAESIVFNLNENTRVIFEYLKVKKIYFRDTLNKSEISLSQIRTNEIMFQEFIKPSSGALSISRLAGLEEDGRIIFRNSNMGNTLFYDCDFASFKSFQIVNSHLLDINYSNIKWPKKIDVANADQFSQTIYSQDEKNNHLREAYRQLKIAAGKQGDKLQEGVFYKMEMNYILKISTLKGNFNTKSALWLNRLTNNHRQSWVQPVIIILILNFLFTGLLCSTVSPPYDFNGITYFNLLNPAHRFSDLVEIEPTFGSYALDLLSRVVNGYLIYQTVAAFRRLS